MTTSVVVSIPQTALRCYLHQLFINSTHNVGPRRAPQNMATMALMATILLGLETDRNAF